MTPSKSGRRRESEEDGEGESEEVGLQCLISLLDLSALFCVSFLLVYQRVPQHASSSSSPQSHWNTPPFPLLPSREMCRSSRKMNGFPAVNCNTELKGRERYGEIRPKQTGCLHVIGTGWNRYNGTVCVFRKCQVTTSVPSIAART